MVYSSKVFFGLWQKRLLENVIGKIKTSTGCNIYLREHNGDSYVYIYGVEEKNVDNATILILKVINEGLMNREKEIERLRNLNSILLRTNNELKKQIYRFHKEIMNYKK